MVGLSESQYKYINFEVNEALTAFMVSFVAWFIQESTLYDCNFLILKWKGKNLSISMAKSPSVFH